MSKLKIEIKCRWTGNILFEYEKENNTLKRTLEQAVNKGADLEGANLRGAYLEGAYLEGANLYGANLEGADLGGANLIGANLIGADLEGAYLEGADLEGANLRGAYLRGVYLYLSDETINEKDVIQDVESKSNLKIKEAHINRNIIPTKWSCFWNYGLIICDWEVKENTKEVQKMTVSEICEELGYDVEIVKGEEE